MFEIIKKLYNNKILKYTFGIVTFLATILTIIAFFQEKKVEVEYEIIANTNVLDLNANISKLDITYDSISLKESNKNLRLYSIKIINKGNLDLLKNRYDENVPLGINISNGKIVEKPVVIQATNSYINDNLKIKSSDEKIVFSRIILESDEFFVVKLLILHKEDSVPKLSSTGKIAGQKSIDIRDRIEIDNQKAIFKQVYEGSFLVQMLRIILYFGVFITTVFITVAIIIMILDRTYKNRRKKIVEDFKESHGNSYNVTDQTVFDLYRYYGSSVIENVCSLTRSEEVLNDKYNKLKSEFPNFNYSNHTNRDTMYSKSFLWKEKELKFIYSMINNGFIYKKGDNLFIIEQIRNNVTALKSFIKKSKYSYL